MTPLKYDFKSFQPIILAEGKMNYQLRETLYLPEGASQSMQSFKVKREGSSTKLKSRVVSREPAGEVRSSLSPTKPSGQSVARQKSDVERRRSGKQLTSAVHGDSPQLSRQKSDSGRTNGKSYDYSNVKGSGYGAVATKSKRESSTGSLKGDEHKRSSTRLSTDGKDPADVKTKVKREKSGDLLGRAAPLSLALKKSTSKEDVKSGALSRTTSGAQKVRTPSVEEEGAKSIDAPGVKKSEVTRSSSTGSQKIKRESRKSTESGKSTTTTTTTTITATTTRKSTSSTKPSSKK